MRRTIAIGAVATMAAVSVALPEPAASQGGIQPGDLVINEIMQNPRQVADAVGEWFEIYNATPDQVLDLAGLTIVDMGNDDFRIPSSPPRLLGPGEFFVLGRSADQGENGGVEVDYAFGGAMQLANGDDEIIIMDGSTVIEMVFWDGGPVFPDPNGASMSLDPGATDTRSNDFGLYWCEAVSTYGDGDQGTPGATNDDCADSDGDGVPDRSDNCDEPNADQADCDGDGIGDACEIADGTQDDENGNGIPDECDGWIINEIHAAPDAIDGDANADGVTDPDDDEFVEIYNGTGGPVDVSGWSISDRTNTRHVFPDGTIIEADCAIVVFGGGTPRCLPGGGEPQAASSGLLGLRDSGDDVRLNDDEDLTRAFYAFGPKGDDGQSLTRDPDITGALPMFKHAELAASNGALFSPTTAVDETPFAGCTISDCNDNGFPDSCDIEEERSTDCNENGIPDECEGFKDCNDNGVPDFCEVDLRPDTDCDGNGIPDECDIAEGRLLDKNGNGYPDECEVEVPQDLIINELRITQPGKDLDEYFELMGALGQQLDGVRYIVIGDGAPAAGSGVIEEIVRLDRLFVPFDRLFLAVEDTFSIEGIFEADLVLDSAEDELNFENDDNVTHVLAVNFNGYLGQDLDHRVNLPEEQCQHDHQVKHQAAKDKPRRGRPPPQPAAAPQQQRDQAGHDQRDPECPIPETPQREQQRVEPTRVPLLVQLDLPRHAVVQPVPAITVRGKHQPEPLGRYPRLGLVALGVDHRPQVLGGTQLITLPAGPVEVQVDRLARTGETV